MDLKFNKKNKNYDTTPGAITFNNTTKMIGVANADNSITEMGGGYSSQLKWGTANGTGTLSAGEIAIASEFGANRFAWYNPEHITIQYSRDNGSSWETQSLSDKDKQYLLTRKNMASITLGNRQEGEQFSTDWQSKVILENPINNNDLYCRIQMFLLNISTNYSRGMKCRIDMTNGKGETSTLIEQGVSGWSGWNAIYAPVVFGGTQTDQIYKLEFIFSCDSYSGTISSTAPQVINIYAYSNTIWGTTNPLADWGQAYYPMDNQNVLFPGNVYVMETYDSDYKLLCKSEVSDLIADSWTWAEY